MSIYKLSHTIGHFSRKYIYSVCLTVFLGISPLLLYPFSKYFGKESEFEGMNHGPYYSNLGDYIGTVPTGLDWILDLFFGLSFYLFIILINFFKYLFFIKTDKCRA